MTWSTTSWSSYFAPVTGGGGGGATPLIVSSLSPGATTIVLTMSGACVLTGDSNNPAKWTTSSPGLPTPVVTNVAVVGSTITLTVTEHKVGSTYTLVFPTGIIQIADGTLFAGPYTRTYTGAGSPPSFSAVTSLDARSFQVVFSEPVVEADALTLGNYSISGPLNVQVVSISKVNAITFIVTTTEQQRGGAYTVTISNVKDLAGNVIA